MKRPVVGVIANAHRVERRFTAQIVGERNLRAVAEVCGALPVIFAGAPDITDIGALLEVVDGVLLTGARANVHPTRFRDRAARQARALRRGARCPGPGAGRGLRRPRCADLRRLPRLSGDERRFRRLAASRDPRAARAHEPSHAAAGDGRNPPRPRRHLRRPPRRHLVPGGAFAKLFGKETIRVNSLHGQGILEPGKRIVVEGVAEDGTIEAIRIADAPGFALGVQWHAEHDAQRNPVNRALFQAFGEALSAHKRGA